MASDTNDSDDAGKSRTPKRRRKKRGSIRGLSTGVLGFDTVLGGDLPAYSFNLIAGNPGVGKTTLAQQIVFANATADSPALYFTVLGEPTLKMLRYQQEFEFFDPALVGSAIQFVNLSQEALDQNLNFVLERIVAEVERVKPGIVVVDSFRTLADRSSTIAHGGDPESMTMDHFIQRLAMHLTTWAVTSFLIGEYADQEQRNPVFTVADGVFWLSQVTDRNSVVRKFQVIKVRGRAAMPGLHTFRITDGGLQIFPRIPEQQSERRPSSDRRLRTGVPGLDEMMAGGIPAGDALMLAGPAGSGKTTFATQFIAEGLRQGEPAVIVVFEEYPEEYLARAKARSPAIIDMLEAGKIEIIYLRPLDLSVDETLAEIAGAVDRLSAMRVVIDSLSGFEVALAPTFREDFRESLYRLIGALTATGVTIVMTAEITGSHDEVRFTTEKVSFVTDDIIVQRLVEIDGELQKVVAVVKMRGSGHSRAFHTYEVTEHGAVVGGTLRNYHGITTGVPDLEPTSGRSRLPGMTSAESSLLDSLIRLGAMSSSELASRAALSEPQLAPALDRLIALGYVEVAARTTNDRASEPTLYRAVAQRE